MTPWSEEQVVAAAPDASSVAAGRKLVKPAPWVESGITDSLLWGACQGSGKKPYQVSIDLTEPAYRCSCPSRKFPCKHAIALLLLWSSGQVAEAGAAAEFAREWVDARTTRAAAKAERSERSEPVDAKAQSKRRDERVAKMDAGVDELVLWLEDLVRAGTAAALAQPSAWWNAAAARLVDAQLPGLAEHLRDVAAGASSGRERWLLRRLGRLWSLASAWRRRETLEAEELAELHIAVGYPVQTATVREGEPVRGRWTVLGTAHEERGPLTFRRTWLRGSDGEFVVLLETQGPGQTFGVLHLPGTVLDGAVHHYPGATPRRILFAEPPTVVDAPPRLGSTTSIRGAVAEQAAALATAPWRTRFPVALAGIRFDRITDPRAIDDDGDALPLVRGSDMTTVLAHTGGQACDMVFELEEGRLRALSAFTDEGVVVP